MFGKMSVGAWQAEYTPPSAIRIAMTTNVYGRRSASRTIHIRGQSAVFGLAVEVRRAYFP